MARSFTSTDQGDLGSFSSPTTAGSVSIWWYPTFSSGDGATHVPYDFDAGGTNQFPLSKDADNGLRFGWYTASVDYRALATPGAYTLNQNAWNHLLGRWSSGGTTLHLNGTQVAVNGSSPTTFTPTRPVVGNVAAALGGGGTASGRLAELAIWNTVLDPLTDIAALNAGISPLLVMPSSLVLYCPLWGIASPENDLVGGASMTLTGTSEAAHPGIFVQPSGRPQVIRQASATGNRRRRVIVCGGVN